MAKYIITIELDDSILEECDANSVAEICGPGLDLTGDTASAYRARSHLLAVLEIIPTDAVIIKRVAS